VAQSLQRIVTGEMEGYADTDPFVWRWPDMSFEESAVPWVIRAVCSSKAGLESCRWEGFTFTVVAG
jgi:hypothetical protein